RVEAEVRRCVRVHDHGQRARGCREQQGKRQHEPQHAENPLTRSPLPEEPAARAHQSEVARSSRTCRAPPAARVRTWGEAPTRPQPGRKVFVYARVARSASKGAPSGKASSAGKSTPGGAGSTAARRTRALAAADASNASRPPRPARSWRVSSRK